MIRLDDIHREGKVELGQRYADIQDGRIFRVTVARDGQYRLHDGVLYGRSDFFIKFHETGLMKRFVALRG